MGHCFSTVKDSDERERNLVWWSCFSIKVLVLFPSRLFPVLSLTLSLTGRTVPYISFTSAFVLHYAVSISSPLNPFSLPALLLSHFPSSYISSISLGSLFK